MSQSNIRSIENIPVEIIHRIFDNLDIQTIFFSIRPVCRLFQSIVNSYHRIHFNFKIISKNKFDVLCRFLSPENLRSLTLYNNEQIPDQISLFLSRIHLRQLTHLHSIHLFGIDEYQLNHLLKRINLNLIQVFSVHLHKYDNRRKKTTADHLSSIVNQPTLRKIEFNIKNSRISEVKWPVNCSIECLSLDDDVTYDNLVKIFSCSPQLHRLIIQEKFSYLVNNFILTSSFPQLTSLIIEQVNVPINQLESFLLLTPSLKYLKFIGECSIFDGKRWEEFLQVNLPHLDQFEFDIICRKLNTPPVTRMDLELIIESFRSGFWIEYKKWFVAVEMDFENSYNFQIYSIPSFKSIYSSEFDSRKICLSTSNQFSRTKNIDQIILRLKMSLNETILTSFNISFPNVTKLHLDFDRKMFVNLIDYLPSIINIYQLIEVKLQSRYFNKDNQNSLCNILKLLEQSSKLSSLIIHSYYCQYKIYPFLDSIIKFLPCQINHLEMPIKQAKQIEMILDRCLHLKIVQFSTKRIILSREISQWFEEKTIGSIFRRSNECDTIWIGNKREENNHFNHKRIKLITDEQMQS